MYSFCLLADDVADRRARRQAAVFGERLSEAQDSVAAVHLLTAANNKYKYKTNTNAVYKYKRLGEEQHSVPPVHLVTAENKYKYRQSCEYRYDLREQIQM